MAYRVVVEVPETLAGSEHDAVNVVRRRMERIDEMDRPLPNPDHQHNWFQRCKSYNKVRASERKLTEEIPSITRLEQVRQNITEVINLIKDERLPDRE